MSEDAKVVIELVLLLLGAGGTFGALRATTKSSAASIAELSKKIEEVVTKLESKLQTVELRAASSEASQTALVSKHDTLASEARTRINAIEGRVSVTEQSNVEMRAEMRALNVTASRIEQSQDRQTQAIEKIHIDIATRFATAGSGRGRSKT